MEMINEEERYEHGNLPRDFPKEVLTAIAIQQAQETDDIPTENLRGLYE